MKVAIVYFEGLKKKALIDLCRGLANGIEAQGHQVDIIDGDRDINTNLTIYRYLVIGTASISSFGGKISRQVERFLANSGILTGKRCFAFIGKAGIRNIKTLQKLMKTMEHEGLYIKFSEILSKKEEAVFLGKKLHIG
jgi:menaquinone-dependent protoporphyrinogen IX oxidase